MSDSIRPLRSPVVSHAARAETRAGLRHRPHRVVMLIFPDAQILDIAGPLEVFARAARWLRDHRHVEPLAYETEVVAARPGMVATSGGLRLGVERAYKNARRIDTLLVAGGIGYEAPMGDADLLSWLRRQAARVERIGSICTGALVLAAAGLLDGKKATTHWAYCDRLAAVAPRASVEPDALYVRTGNVYTSAGVTAGMDMALAMVEQDWDKAAALAVAQELVMFLKRPGGQSQFSRHLQAQQHDDELGRLELWILENLDADLSVAALARRANVSMRHFARRFTERFGVTPAAYVARARVEAARRRIEQGATRLKTVARQCGFADEQRMRRAFRRTLGVAPIEYRARFGH